VFQSHQLVKNNISHMNPSYFTEEHQLFREFKRFFTKRSCTAHRKMGKREQLNASYGKVREMLFWYKLSGGIWWVKLIFLTVIFLEELQKIKSSGFAAMWAHSYLAMTLKCRRRRKN
jgi:hypothetical protein